MRRFLAFVIAVSASLGIWAQQTVVSGTVVNETTGKPVAGASVSTKGIAVVTNDDGFFTLKGNTPIGTVTVSYVGFHSQKLHLKDKTEDKLTIRLRPSTIQLQEVLVMADNAREIVEKAISRIPHNYNSQPELYHSFYREKVMKRQHYISIAEGVTDIYKTDYLHDISKDRVAIRKGRRLLSPKKTDTLSVKVMGGPVTAIYLDIVKNTSILLNTEELNLYNLKMEMPTTIADRKQFVVSLSPRATMPYALYYGRLYIDQETLAFTRIELSLDMSDRIKATDMMLVKKPKGLRFRPKELSSIVDYHLGDDGLSRVSYVSTTFRFNCDWKRRLFATSFAAFCEMAVTSTTDQDVHPIKGRDSFDQHDAFFDRVDYFRDPEFWQDYNIIEPSESLDKAIEKILKKHDN